MFGLSKKRISAEQIADLLVGFLDKEKLIASYKDFLKVNTITSNQLREIYIFNMHATVYAIQSSIDSKELTQKIIDLYNTKAIHQLDASNHKSQTAIMEVVNSRYKKYFEIIQDAENIKSEKLFFILAIEFLNIFFQDKNNNSGTTMTMLHSVLYTNQIVGIKSFLDEIQIKYQIV